MHRVQGLEGWEEKYFWPGRGGRFHRTMQLAWPLVQQLGSSVCTEGMASTERGGVRGCMWKDALWPWGRTSSWYKLKGKSPPPSPPDPVTFFTVGWSLTKQLSYTVYKDSRTSPKEEGTNIALWLEECFCPGCLLVLTLKLVQVLIWCHRWADTWALGTSDIHGEQCKKASNSWHSRGTTEVNESCTGTSWGRPTKSVASPENDWFIWRA